MSTLAWVVLACILFGTKAVRDIIGAFILAVIILAILGAAA